MNKCGTCEHFAEVKEEPRGPVLVQKDKKREGFCMHSPPLVVAIPVQGRGGQVGIQMVTTYPRVSEENAACAQYKMRAPK